MSNIEYDVSKIERKQAAITDRLDEIMKILKKSESESRHENQNSVKSTSNSRARSRDRKRPRINDERSSKSSDDSSTVFARIGPSRWPTRIIDERTSSPIDDRTSKVIDSPLIIDDRRKRSESED